jgi:hypothetical protein
LDNELIAMPPAVLNESSESGGEDSLWRDHPNNDQPIIPAPIPQQNPSPTQPVISVKIPTTPPTPQPLLIPNITAPAEPL